MLLLVYVGVKLSELDGSDQKRQQEGYYTAECVTASAQIKTRIWRFLCGSLCAHVSYDRVLWSGCGISRPSPLWTFPTMTLPDGLWRAQPSTVCFCVFGFAEPTIRNFAAQIKYTLSVVSLWPWSPPNVWDRDWKLEVRRLHGQVSMPDCLLWIIISSHFHVLMCFKVWFFTDVWVIDSLKLPTLVPG